MRALVVMAHYDADGQVSGHALRQMDAWAEVADRLIVVSTAELKDPTVVREITSRAELVTRPNFGYDFYSYKTGLDRAGDLSGYDYVVVCNDSYVGPLIPYRRIFADMEERPADFWGLTYTPRRGWHVQSFFVAFRSWVARSEAFRSFWRTMTPISDRAEVIRRYELGMTAHLRSAGFRPGGYFQESEADRRLARARHLWFAWHVIRAQPRARRGRALRRVPLEPWNPVACLADRALTEGRLPVVKIDTLRYDPYRLGSDRLLRACEERYPEQFADVRAYLERTQVQYPGRAGESTGPVVPPWPVRAAIGYVR